MARFITRRLLLAIVTLWLLATIVFVIANVLPADVGRTILGPFAPQESVDALNQRLGTDRPILVRYVDAMKGIVTLDFGDSFVSGQPVLPQLLGAVGRSAKLAALALVITIPISILAGLYRRQTQGSQGGSGDRPARGHVVIHPRIHHRHDPGGGRRRPARLVAGRCHGAAQLRHPDADPLPADARDRDGDRLLRVHREDDAAGAIDVLQSDYTRTATMKGLTPTQTMRHHVLRNALVPTVAVIAVQIGYLFGGIIAVEKIFNYNGMGATMLFAAQNKDLPMLTTGVLIIGIVYMLATLAADLIMAWMNPRIRLDASS